MYQNGTFGKITNIATTVKGLLQRRAPRGVLMKWKTAKTSVNMKLTSPISLMENTCAVTMNNGMMEPLIAFYSQVRQQFCKIWTPIFLITSHVSLLKWENKKLKTYRYF